MTGELPLGSRLHGHLKVSVSSLSCVRDSHSSPNKKSGLQKGFCSEKKYQKPLTERNGERHKRQASCLNTKTQLNGGKRRFFFSLSLKRRRRGKVSLWPGHWETKKCLSNSQCGTYPFIVLGLASPQPGWWFQHHISPFFFCVTISSKRAFLGKMNPTPLACDCTTNSRRQTQCFSSKDFAFPPGTRFV